MKKKTTYRIFVFLLALIFSSFLSFSQKEGNIWYFGKYAGVNFNGYNPTAITNSAMFQYEGCATISDSNGNLLFYTNGMTVWNKSHQTMENGTGLKGGYPSTQSSIIVPRPKSNKIYFIFTIDDVAGPNGLQYSTVNMSLAGGKGKVISKNNLLITPTTEKVTAVRCSNGTDTWVITHGWDTNAFFTYMVDSTGINSTPIVSNVGYKHGGSLSKASGYLKASPDGSKIAIAQQSYNGLVQILDFNDSTGYLSNPITISSIHDPYGLEFSPDGSKLYISSQSTGEIYQFNLQAGSTNDILSSEYQVGISASQVGALQIAIDGKIYIARTSGYLGIIKNPNAFGSGCNFQDNGLYLGGKESKYGLPTFNQSYFYNPDFYYENFCFGDSTKFYIYNTSFVDSVRWYFGDFNSGSKNTSTDIHPSHLYTAPGSYSLGLFIHHQGTTDTITWTLPIYPKPEIDFTINDSAQCLKGNTFVFTNLTSISKGSINYLWNFGDTASSEQKSPIYSYGSSDTFKTTLYAVSNHGCKDTFSKYNIVFPSPDADFSMNDSAQCFDKNEYKFINLSSIDYGSLIYYWTFGDGKVAIKNNPTHTYTSADTFLVNLIATSNQGCKDTATEIAYVHVHPTPTAIFSINDSSQCFKGNHFIFTNNSHFNDGAVSYEWYFDDGDTSHSENVTHSYDTNSTFMVTLFAISEFNCKDEMTKNAHVHPMPNAKFILNDSSQCLNKNQAEITNNSTINSGNMNYFWDFGDGLTSNTKNPVHQYLTDDSFNIKLAVFSDFGCSDSTSKKIFVQPMPSIDFTINDNTQCFSDNNFIFTNSSTIKYGSITTYEWQTDDGNSFSSKNLTHSYTTHNEYDVQLLCISDKGCKDSIQKKAFVFPMPKTNFIIDDSVQCFGNNKFAFEDKSTIVEGIIESYYWQPGDGSVYLTRKFNHSFSNPNTYLAKLYSSSDQGCVDSATKMIIVNPNPETKFSINDKEQCLNNNLFVYKNNSTIQSGSINSNLWDVGDGTNYNLISLSHTYSAYDTFEIILKTISDKGCTDSLNKTVYVHAMPKAKFDVNKSKQCLDNNNFDFVNTSTIVNGSLTGYFWTFGDGGSSYANSPDFSYTDDGTYNVELKVTSNHGCTDSTTTKMTVFPMPQPDFDNSMPCLNVPTNFSDKSTITSPGNITQWQWHFGNGASSTNSSPSCTYDQAGIYVVNFIATSDKGCNSSTSKTLKVNNHVSQNYLIRTTVENNDHILIEWTASPSGSPAKYILERSDGNGFNEIAKLSPTTLSYKDYNANISSNSYSYRIKVVDSCNYQSNYSNIGKSILLTIDANKNPLVLNWTKYEEWKYPVENYKIQLQNTETYFFEEITTLSSDSSSFTDANNSQLLDEYCYKITAYESDTNTISNSNVACESIPLLVWIPNTFTPNNDGINDTYKIIGKYIVDFQIGIFNRWGEEVFKSNDINNCWDGTFRNKLCETDTYFFRLVVKGTKEQKRIENGTLLLLR